MELKLPVSHWPPTEPDHTSSSQSNLIPIDGCSGLDNWTPIWAPPSIHCFAVPLYPPWNQLYIFWDASLVCSTHSYQLNIWVPVLHGKPPNFCPLGVGCSSTPQLGRLAVCLSPSLINSSTPEYSKWTETAQVLLITGINDKLQIVDALKKEVDLEDHSETGRQSST